MTQKSKISAIGGSDGSDPGFILSLSLQFHALYYLINQTEIHIAVKKLKHNKSFSDKIKNKRVKYAVK